jgi:hypothetical protein
MIATIGTRNKRVACLCFVISFYCKNYACGGRQKLSGMEKPPLAW